MHSIIAVGVTAGLASRRAAEWAVQRATETRDRLLFVSVLNESHTRGASTTFEREREAAELLLDQTVAHARERGVTAERTVERGAPLTALIDVSQRAEMLVIGRDRSRSETGRRGPLATQIGAGAHCPVVVVPGHSVGGEHGIVVGIDGSKASSRALAFAATEAARTRESLTVVMAWAPVPMPMQIGSHPREYLVEAQEWAEEQLGVAIAGLKQDLPDLQLRMVVQPGGAAELIDRESRDARLAVVGSHSRGPLGRFLLGSTAAKLLEDPPTILAIVR